MSLLACYSSASFGRQNYSGMISNKTKRSCVCVVCVYEKQREEKNVLYFPRLRERVILGEHQTKLRKVCGAEGEGIKEKERDRKPAKMAGS